MPRNIERVPGNDRVLKLTEDTSEIVVVDDLKIRKMSLVQTLQTLRSDFRETELSLERQISEMDSLIEEAKRLGIKD